MAESRGMLILLQVYNYQYIQLGYHPDF